jgi:hypothetical protein
MVGRGSVMVGRGSVMVGLREGPFGFFFPSFPLRAASSDTFSGLLCHREHPYSRDGKRRRASRNRFAWPASGHFFWRKSQQFRWISAGGWLRWEALMMNSVGGFIMRLFTTDRDASCVCCQGVLFV